jgi:hypothetical protein
MAGLFHSDSGAPCMCGGTIYRYSVWGGATKRVDTFCFTCHTIEECAFFMDHDPLDASEVSRAHRGD